MSNCLYPRIILAQIAALKFAHNLYNNETGIDFLTVPVLEMLYRKKSKFLLDFLFSLQRNLVCLFLGVKFLQNFVPLVIVNNLSDTLVINLAEVHNKIKQTEKE